MKIYIVIENVCYSDGSVDSTPVKAIQNEKLAKAYCDARNKYQELREESDQDLFLYKEYGYTSLVLKSDSSVLTIVNAYRLTNDCLSSNETFYPLPASDFGIKIND